MSKLRKNVIGNPYCDFCGTLKFERGLMFDWVEKYKIRAHVKTANAYTGVKLVNYACDNRFKIREKQTKLFNKIRFCPICGYDYVNQEVYNGKLYLAANINTLWEAEQKRGK